jgi:hypothetical protein
MCLKLSVPGRRLLVAAVLLMVLQPARGSEPVRSLEWVPDDVAFYGSLLRCREQIEAIGHSHAWAKLRTIPAVRKLWRELRGSIKENPALAQAGDWAKEPENRRLIDLLADMGSHEVVFYGGQKCAEFTENAVRVINEMRFGALFESQETDNDQAQQKLHALLRSLSDDLDALVPPDLVLACRVKNTDQALEQLKRLETLVRDQLKSLPDWDKRFGQTPVEGGKFLTLTLDGSMAPWRDMFARVEKEDGEFDELAKKLKGLKTTINVGVRDGYVFVSVGVPADQLGRLGDKKPLANRLELKPLAEHASRRVTSVTYLSQDFAKRTALTKSDIEQGLEQAAEQLKALGLPDETQERIKGDLKLLAEDLKKFIAEPGARMAYSFLTDRGLESFDYDWGARPTDDVAKPLAILEHLGGDPALFVACRRNITGETYAIVSKWLQKLTGYAEDIGLPFLDEEKRDNYQRVTKAVFPLLKRFDEVTSKQLIPALKDGQSALVVDDKLSSRQWAKAMPKADTPLPILEPALVLGISDPERLKEAFGNYRKIVNDGLDAARELGAPIPDFKIPAPKTQTETWGSLYFYPRPRLDAAGVDKQITPVAGLSKTYLVLAISHEHAQRLLTRAPLKTSDGPMAKAQEPLSTAGLVDFGSILGVAEKWVLYQMKHAEKETDTADHKSLDILNQTSQMFVVATVLRRFSSVTYREGGAWVSHAELWVQDIEPKLRPADEGEARREP